MQAILGMSSVRRRLGMAAAILLALTLAPAVGTAEAAPQSEYPGQNGTIVTREGGDLIPTIRWRGTTRYDTARLIATDDTAEGTPFFSGTVLVARGDLFPDALAGNYLAGLTGAPILLTDPDQLPIETIEALQELTSLSLTPPHVVLLGGAAAISEEIEAQIARDFDPGVERIEGADRYQTAALLAAAETVPAGTAIVASGETFPDALVAGPLSFSEGIPLLLSERTALPQVTADALEALEVENVLLAGGTQALAPGVQDSIEALGIQVQRVAGAGRSGTAAAFARLAIERFGYTRDHVTLATGANFPDALTAGPHAGTERAPILITDAAGAIDQELTDYFEETATCAFYLLHIAGGPKAVPTAVEDAARAALTTGFCGVRLSEETTIELVGAPHTVTAEITEATEAGERPLSGATVTFSLILLGETAPATVLRETTNDQGVATAVLTTLFPGDYQIQACAGISCPDPLGVEFQLLDVVAEGLASPRGMEFGPDDVLHVAENGFGGDDCREVEPGFELCFGETGSVARVTSAGLERPFSGLPSYRNPFGGAAGPSDVSFDGVGNAYVTIQLGAPAVARDQLGEVAENFGKLARISPNGEVDYVADLAQYEQENNPDGQPSASMGPADSNPYAVVADGDAAIVADAAGNTLLRVEDGRIETLAVFPEAQTPAGPAPSAPTSVVIGPDGAYYVGELGGQFPGGSRVWRVDPAGGEPKVHQEGFFFVLDLAFGPDGSLYVLQALSADTFAAGEVIRVAPDGTRTTVAREGLSFPLGMAVGPDGDLFVTNCGFCGPGAGAVSRITDPETRNVPPPPEGSGFPPGGRAARAATRLVAG